MKEINDRRSWVGVWRLLLVCCGTALVWRAPSGYAESAQAADAVVQDDRRMLADGLFVRGLYELAGREYAALVEDAQMPGRDLLLFRLGECWRKLKQPARAEEAYARLARDFPASPERARAQLQRALLATETNRYDTAVALLTPLAGEKLPEELRGAVLHCLGEALEQTGDPAGARARFEQVRREQPASEYAAFAGLRLGAILGRSKLPEERREAYAVYRDAAARTPAQRVAAEALFQAAELAFAERQFADSAACYAELRRRFPGDIRAAGADLPAAWAHHHAGQHKEALALAAAHAQDASPERRAEWLYLSANANRMLGRLQEAAASYLQLLKTVPSDARAPAARYERLLCLAGLKEHRTVLAESEGFVPADEHQAGLLWLRAEAETALENLPRAMNAYGALADRFPESPFAIDAIFRLGWLQQRQQQWGAAAASYRRVVERAPKHPLAPQALFSAGICHAQAAEGAKALQAWTELIERYPYYEGLDETFFQKAMEEARAGALAAGIVTLDSLLEKFPKSGRRADALFWRASVRRQQGGPNDRIMADLREAIAGGADAGVVREARLLLGSILQQQGQDAEAAACFQPLLDGPGRARLTADRLAWLCEFQYGRGAYPEAEAAARTLVERERDAEWRQTGWTLLARAVRAQRRPEEAMAAFGHALEADARTRFGAEAALRLGELLLDAGRLSEAETRLRDAAARSSAPELQNLRAHAYAGLGRCAELQGNRDAAIRAYLAVSILYEDEFLVPAALDKAATLLSLAGRKEESRISADELITRFPGSPQAQAWRNRMGLAAPTNAPAGKGAP